MSNGEARRDDKKEGELRDDPAALAKQLRLTLAVAGMRFGALDQKSMRDAADVLDSFARSAEGARARPEEWFLIELGSPASFFTGDVRDNCGWTADALKAARFPSRAAADAVAVYFELRSREMQQVRIEPHIFGCGTNG